MIVPRSGAGPGSVLVEGVEAGHEMGAAEGSLWPRLGVTLGRRRLMGMMMLSDPVSDSAHGSQVPKSSSQRPLSPHQAGPRLLLRPRRLRLLLLPGRLQP